MLEGGQSLNYKLMGEIISQELELIRINEPDRVIKVIDKDGKVSKQFAARFAKQYGLYDFVSQKAQCESRREYECDICCKKFTFKNSMVSHRKNTHFSFLL